MYVRTYVCMYVCMYVHIRAIMCHSAAESNKGKTSCVFFPERVVKGLTTEVAVASYNSIV